MLARQVLAEARALLAEGQSEDAARLSQAMLTHRIGESEQQATAVALIARCQSAQQQPELEQITLTRLASLFPASEPSATALWQVAQAQEQAGNAQEAAKTYQTLLAQSPAEKEELVLRAQAMKRAADLAARNGGDAQAVAARYAAAREALKQAQREAKEAPQVRDGRVLLEMAQVQEALQEKPKAIETLVELVQQYPNTDSARQAEARLEELI
jgi:TolA-binding protein